MLNCFTDALGGKSCFEDDVRTSNFGSCPSPSNGFPVDDNECFEFCFGEIWKVLFYYEVVEFGIWNFMHS